MQATSTLSIPLPALDATAQVTLAGAWRLHVAAASSEAVLAVPPQKRDAVAFEKYDFLDDFKSTGGGWTRGTRLKAAIACECTVRHAVLPSTVIVSSASDGTGIVYERGKDYDLVEDWATVGRLPEGRIPAGQPVFISYDYTKLRLDSIVLTRDGAIELRLGTPHSVNPAPPELAEGETRIANIWHSAPPLGEARRRLTVNDLLPVLETAFPEPPRQTPPGAATLLPRSYAKLQRGEKLRILAWGDSVTQSSYLKDREREAWQHQFLSRLKERFPKADIDLVTEAWGGRNTKSYLAEPEDSPHNYTRKVLGANADLIVSEFVNDAAFTPESLEERYERIRKDFQGIGAEWIILTPHYVRPDWMGLDREADIDDDPRPLVAFLREFARRHAIPLADASRRYGRLWRQGIPYSTLMVNAINHPSPQGMKIFADALMSLF